MKVKIDSIYDISETSAKAIGTVLDLGNGIEEHGHCWSTNPAPEYGEDEVSFTEKGEVSRVGAYTSNISPLEPETKYYIRAYIRKGDEIKHSEVELSFTTSATPISLPVVTIGSVQSLTTNEATVSGSVDDIGTGAASVSEHGHCWSNFTTAPTVNDLKTSLGARTSTGSYMSTLGSLSPATKYYVRAYATNPAGTAYSSNYISFTTPEDISAPTVTTTEVTNVTKNTAVCGGTVISDGGAEVLEKGVCWNTSPEPTLINKCTKDGTGTEAYTSFLKSLAKNTKYYVRAYAKNNVGTAYGEQKIFTTLAEWVVPGDDWTDTRDGQEYGTVQIGSQIWMAENLNVGVQITGSEIPGWNTIIEKYCYDDNSSKCDVYGGLYTWYEMMGWEYMESIQGICPDGWHLPSDNEWWELESFLGIDESERYLAFRGTDEAYDLMEGGYTGFNALMVGYRDWALEIFDEEGVATYFWTTTQFDEYMAIFRQLVWNSGQTGFWADDKEYAASVRCIKD